MDKSFSLIVALLCVISIVSCNSTKTKETNTSQARSDDRQQERRTNWKTLFDGVSADQWRGFKKQDLPEGWIVDDGNLVALGKGGDLGGDIISKGQFEDFDLYL
jgi:hypothetical protein